MQLPQNIIIMKVGPHSNMSLTEIIDSKKEEEINHGVHFWGYSGVFCQPKATQLFCNKCLEKFSTAPKLVLLETKSPYVSNIGYIKHFSEDGVKFSSFQKPVQLQGAQFSFVARNLRIIENFPLDSYIVVGGKNDKQPLLSHLKFRVNKSFATLNQNYTGTNFSRVFIADLVAPYAIWLK